MLCILLFIHHTNIGISHYILTVLYTTSLSQRWYQPLYQQPLYQPLYFQPLYCQPLYCQPLYYQYISIITLTVYSQRARANKRFVQPNPPYALSRGGLLQRARLRKRCEPRGWQAAHGGRTGEKLVGQPGCWPGCETGLYTLMVNGNVNNHYKPILNHYNHG